MNKEKSPKIELIVHAPSNDKKVLKRLRMDILKSMLKNMVKDY